MKAKTINAILCKKFDAFMASITDEPTRKLVGENTIITGGCIVSLLQNENVNDYDLYFRNGETALAVAKYYCTLFSTLPAGAGYTIDCELKTVNDETGEQRVTISVNKSKNVTTAGQAPEDNDMAKAEELAGLRMGAGPEAISAMVEATDNLAAAKLEGGKEPKDTGNYLPLFLSSNAITLSTKVQLVTRFFGDPEAIHDNYDFIHCTSYWTSWDRKVVLPAEALESILTKELRYMGSKYPICSIIRTRKFLARGWTINAGQYVKMAWQVNGLDLTNIEVLKDQLVGVDSTYFYMLIGALQKDMDAKEKAQPNDFVPTVDGSYLMTLIDKIF